MRRPGGWGPRRWGLTPGSRSRARAVRWSVSSRSRARRIAEETLTLSAEAAAWVDAQVAPFAHRTGVAQTQRLVAEAIARFMPEHAARERERAADQRYFTIA